MRTPFSATFVLLCVVSAGFFSTVAGAQTPVPNEEFATAADFARRFFESGNFDAALTWLQKADSILRDQPAVLYNTALVLVKLERYDEAQRTLDRYIALYPQGQELQAAKSLARELQFGIEVRREAQLNNEYRTMFSRAKALYAKNLRREALDAFRQAEQLKSGDPALHYNEAVLYEEDGALEDALRSYNRYLQTTPTSAPELQAHIIDLEREIGDTRTKLMCPVCGAKLSAGARWCHRCWHGPYDVTSAAWNARACESHATVTRTIQDGMGKSRVSETLDCLFAGRSLRDFLRYNPMTQAAIQEARTAEGWSLSAGLLQTRKSGSGNDITLRQGDALQRLEVVATGEAFPYKAHTTADGIWLLDSQQYSTGDQVFTVSRSFDGEGRVLREDVNYDSAACRHAVSYAATYTYNGDNVVGAQIVGGYDGARAEGNPQVRWEARVSRTFDQNARLTNEELTLTSFQKTYMTKPQGKVSAQVRRVYQNLKTRRPIDIRTNGDVCGSAGTSLLEEPIDLRPLFIVSPALAVRLAPGDAKAVVQYAYQD